MGFFLRKAVMVISLAIIFGSAAIGQQLTSLPRGGNKRASVSEEIGLTNVIIRYSRPGVKKRRTYLG